MHATVRPAHHDDMEAVTQIYAHYVATSVATFEENPPDVHRWRAKLDALREHGLPFLVAGPPGRVDGYALADLWRERPGYRHTVQDSIYLAPGRTGQGLGRALLEELLARCAQAGMRQVVAVIADTGDPGSHRLHLRAGFTEAGLLKAVGRKHGRWVDTLLMQRALAPPQSRP
ncbi:GNAT family N-acetyltransferase [Sphaerisporangium sp. TRM90804]|uniref:GNAT family N-acetyltransferase n=1 Tax=Sphaerisporangium sp. TRM90804 TaxID=3031113 RepID=UPI0024476817|nr:GNAT family N-acetyltransferase [Sphaerisporangium sp. TRM90804]MDH2430608.1 GNAT family N-acetyltransferase [Sphaerisporangium sp. TRM90804]